jgi:hypothetical protein
VTEQNPVYEPVDNEVVDQITLALQADGPDEFPEAFYRTMAESLYRSGARARDSLLGEVETDARVLLAGKVERIKDVQRGLIVRSDAETDDPALSQVYRLHAEGLGLALTILQTDDE